MCRRTCVSSSHHSNLTAHCRPNLGRRHGLHWGELVLVSEVCSSVISSALVDEATVDRSALPVVDRQSYLPSHRCPGHQTCQLSQTHSSPACRQTRTSLATTVPPTRGATPSSSSLSTLLVTHRNTQGSSTPLVVINPAVRDQCAVLPSAGHSSPMGDRTPLRGSRVDGLFELFGRPVGRKIHDLCRA